MYARFQHLHHHRLTFLFHSHVTLELISIQPQIVVCAQNSTAKSTTKTNFLPAIVYVRTMMICTSPIICYNAQHNHIYISQTYLIPRSTWTKNLELLEFLVKSNKKGKNNNKELGWMLCIRLCTRHN